MFVLPHTARELMGSWGLWASLGCVATAPGGIAVLAGGRTRATVKVTLTLCLFLLCCCLLGTNKEVSYMSGRNYRRKTPEEWNLQICERVNKTCLSDHLLKKSRALGKWHQTITCTFKNSCIQKAPSVLTSCTALVSGYAVTAVEYVP